MTEQEKINLVTNYFAEDWSIEKALLLLEDYQKMMETQPPLLDAQYACVTELEQAAHQALEVLDYYAKPLCMCFAGCDECDPSKVPNEQMVITALRKALIGVQALSAASPTPPAEQQAQPDECFPGEPKVAVPQGLIGAACFAIRNKRDGGKVLEQLRRYSVGDRSQPLTSHGQAPATQQAGEMEVFGLQWPGEDRINLSTVFDTEAEALDYMQNRCDTPGIRLVRFSSKATTAQAADSTAANTCAAE